MSTLVNCYIKILEEAEVTDSIPHTDRFSKPKILVYNSEVPDKWWRRRSMIKRAITKHYPLQTNAKTVYK